MVAKRLKVSPFIVFKYYLINSLGILWIKEISKLLAKRSNKKQFKIVLDCKKNPALAINCIRYGFSYIIFDGNNILKKKIMNASIKHKVNINPKVEIFDLKRIKNCNRYALKIINKYKKRKI